MNTDEISILITLRMSSSHTINLIYDDLLKKAWVLKAIPKYLEAAKLEVDKATQIMILTCADGVIGYAVKYIDLINKWAKLENTDTITFDDFCTKIFPFGFPDFSKTSSKK